MQHRAWLILSLAAYFGLSTPLCTYVCLFEVGASETDSATRAHGSHGSHHSEEHHSDTARGDQPFDQEWDCDELDQSLLAKGDRPRPTPSFDWAAPVVFGRRIGPQIEKLLFTRLDQASLPPPDILLLKSTLLI